MLEKIYSLLPFLLFLCPLIFFHELGHFLFARLFGVRVEVFSLGFGPKLFRFNRSGTEFAFSIIPLGGYVKMFGDDPLNMDAVPLDQRHLSFTHKGKWARFWIVFGGPLANFILSFVLFYALLLNGEKVPEIKIGVIPTNTILYERGIRTGDVIHGVDGQEIIAPTDLPIEESKIINIVEVIRAGAIKQVPVNMNAKDLFESMFKSPPILRKPIVVDTHGKRFTVGPVNIANGTPLSLEEYSEFKGDIKLLAEKVEDSKTITITENDSFSSKLLAMNMRPLDLMVKSINMSSPADKAGIKGGDVILKVGTHDMLSFEKMREIISGLGDESINLEVARAGNVVSISIKPEIIQQEGKATKVIGVYSAVEYLDLKFKNTPSKGVFEAMPIALIRTWDTIVKTLDGFKKIITNEVSLRSIGGPIAIGKVANESFNMSLSYFFQLMALISVNLGIINLFPIPVLDGGHIMFIFLEILNRGPVSRKKLEIAQQFGLSVLLILFAAALFNDFSRFF